MKRFRAFRLDMLAWAVCLCGLACRATGPDHLPQEDDRVAMLSLMVPETIRIQPFTRIGSFNDDPIPDGLIVVLEPRDPFGDPVKAAGLFYFELWSYQNASHDRRGERLEFWERKLESKEDIRQHWNSAQMYEFQLAWTQGAQAVQPGRKYLLTATYRTPWDTTIRDEYVLDFVLPNIALTDLAATRPAGP